mgnify:CR=1 FL=1
MRTFLTIDVGNTNVKYALFKNSKLVKFWSHPTAETNQRCAAVLGETRVPIALCSVVPAASAVIRQVAAGRQIIEVTAALQDILKGMPDQMGADRVAAAVAAWKIYGKGRQPVVVMSFGSATTLLAIDKTGEQRGGWIAPGISMTLEALHRCALLPLMQMEQPATELGFTTETHMRNGVFVAHVGAAREYLKVATAELGSQAVCVATGGWAGAVQKHGELFDHVDAELTLKGIYLIASRATRGKTRNRRVSKAS